VEPEQSIEAIIAGRLTALSQTLATAESCSGGLIAHRLTDIPGASAFFVGGIVAYSNELKIHQLGVDAGDLIAQGAVSETVARQMAEGAREKLGVDWAIGVTGIAGPSGGTPDKPVGLVYIGVAAEGGTRATRNEFSGSRQDVKSATADAALQLLWECMQ